MRLATMILGLAILTIAGTAHAVPSTVEFSGRLTNASGPVTGPVTLVFSIYGQPAGGSAVWTEVRASVTAGENGLVFVDLGAVTPFGGTVFDGSDRWLEISVNGDILAPRLAVQSVPYAMRAAYAEETGAVPTGAVMMFDLDACPPGWTALDAARGRALVGLPTGGMVGGTVGTALTNLENRSHTHSVDPVSVTSSMAADHTHSVDPATVTSLAQSVPHTHTVDPPSFTTTPISHDHVWARYSGSLLEWTTGAGVSIIDWTNGVDGSGGGEYPLAPQLETQSHTYTTDSDTHSHTVNLAAITSSDASTTSHSHDVNVGPTTSTAAGAHQHTCDVGNTVSTAATTGQIMPYVQLLVCRKD